MKRLFVLVAITLVVAGGATAQDLSGLGRDFEVVVESVGEQLLGDLEQSAIWGQYPGMATYADRSGFFFTIATGALLTDGILGFANDSDAFTVLNVPVIIDEALAGLPDQFRPQVTGLVNGMETFFPLPISRLAAGFVLPGDVEAMVEVGGFPQFLTGAISSFAGLDGLVLNSLHVGTRVRKAVLNDAGPFPAISVGGGYAYTGLGLGYDLVAIGEPFEDFALFPGTALGDLYVKGDLQMGTNIHAFGLDLQASKAFGFFVPYLGISPYYHFASFSGEVDGFEAFLDYDGANPDPDNPDAAYTGRPPATAWVDNDLSFVLFGGFEMIFGGFGLQIGSSWNVAKGSPGVTLNLRWQ